MWVGIIVACIVAATGAQPGEQIACHQPVVVIFETHDKCTNAVAEAGQQLLDAWAQIEPELTQGSASCSMMVPLKGKDS